VDDGCGRYTYLIQNEERLDRDSRRFQHPLFSRTLPSYVLDAVVCPFTVPPSASCWSGRLARRSASHSRVSP